MKKTIMMAASACIVIAVMTGCKTDDEPVQEPQAPTTGNNNGVTTPPTGDNGGQGQPDGGDAVADFHAIRLNELNGNKPKFIELVNTADADVDISGMKLRKNGDEMVYEAPQGTVIPAKGLLVLLSDQEDPALGFNAGLSAKKSVQIELLGPEGSVIDIFVNPSLANGYIWDEGDPKYNGDATGLAYGRYPDGTGAWYMIESTQGQSNNSAKTSEQMTW